MISPPTPNSIVAVGAASNIVRKRSSVSRRSEVVESERCASASGASTTGTSHGLMVANSATATPESRDHVLDPEAGRREKPGFAEAVPAAEPQHDCEQNMVDDDEDAGRNQAGEREAEIAVLADRLDREPRREAAEREVRDVERLDVPRVAVADRERGVQCEHECDDEERRQHERAGDHERRRGVEAVVPADGTRNSGATAASGSRIANASHSCCVDVSPATATAAATRAASATTAA